MPSNPLTNYHLKPQDTLPYLAWQEKKEKRKQVLEAVRHRRREMYRQMLQRRKAMKSSYF